MEAHLSDYLIRLLVVIRFFCSTIQSDVSTPQGYTVPTPGKLVSIEEPSEGHCSVNADEKDDASCLSDRKYTEGLHRWDPVEIGHTREIILRGEKREMITRATQPPVFEIPDFLSNDECQHLKKLALDAGLVTSKTHVDEETRKFIKRQRDTEAKEYFGSFSVWDLNEDRVITKSEMKQFIQNLKQLYLKEEDIEMMIDILDFQELFEDGGITYDEWGDIPVESIEDFLDDIQENDPRHMHRYSQQAWLYQSATDDPVLLETRKRVQELTRLHPRIISGIEPLQVLRYGPRGHYHAHYDSQSTNDTHLNCCHFVNDTNCRLCRYMTILYYLNDVEEGGETAFPVADRKDFNETEFRERRNGDYYNLNQHCYDSEVVIPPKKGTAIMWYNHFLGEDGKWLGAMDPRSLHGGCEVRKGVKWAANNWIPGPELQTAHFKSKYIK